MVIELPPVSGALVVVHAADAPAVKIAQPARILDRLPERARVRRRLSRRRGVAPEQSQAHRDRDQCVEKRRAEQRGHRLVRHQPIEGAGPGVDAEQGRGIVEGGEAQQEAGDAQGGDDRDRKAVALEHAREGRRPGIGAV